MVAYDDSTNVLTYISASSGNINNTPGTGGFWAVVGIVATGVQGPIGPLGPAGPQGDTGIRGSITFSGSGAPSTVAGSLPGDWYTQSDSSAQDGNVYERVGENWAFRLNIKGPIGSVWHSGSTTPSIAIGTVGDFYLDETTSDTYEKTDASTWTFTANLRGVQGTQGDLGDTGARGSVFDTGAPLPDVSVYSVDDYFIIMDATDLDSHGKIYKVIDTDLSEETEVKAWEEQGNLQGPQGLVGPQGTSGSQGQPGDAGTEGSIGIQGIQGVQGPIGPTGPIGTEGAVGPRGDACTVNLSSISFQGNYDAAVSYTTNDLLVYSGSVYIALNEDITPATLPTDTSNFAVFSLVGAQGVEGPVGQTGPEGQAGRVAYDVQELGALRTLYTVLPTDNGTTIVLNSTDDITINLPDDLTQSIQVSFLKTSGDTKNVSFVVNGTSVLKSKMNLNTLAIQFGAATLMHTSNGTWYLTGDIE